MALNPFAAMPFSWVYCTYFLCFFLLTLVSTNSSSSSSSSTPTTSVSYADHCSSFVPESTPTARITGPSVPTLFTPYLAGGDKLLGVKQLNQSFYNMGKFLKLRIQPIHYKTIAKGIYKVEGFLSIQTPYYSNETENSAYAGSYYFTSSGYHSIGFRLTGFWSGISRKLCMVGFASSHFSGIRTVGLDVVLKLNFASVDPNIYTSVVSGTLESISSLVDDPGYFDPIFIFQFPDLSNYIYSLVSGENGGGSFPGDSQVVRKNRSSGSKSINICSMVSSVLGMESQTGLLSSGFLALIRIQCSIPAKKLRFMVKFQNMSYVDQEFDLESTLIGEASWDDKNSELNGVACRLLNPVVNSKRIVGDCSMRLSLKYSSVWTLRNEPKAVGQFWSTKKVADSGYFGKVNLTSFDPVTLPDLRYEYTEMGRVKKSCPVKKPTKKGMDTYPDGHSYNMRFDLSVKNSKGEGIAWGYANPISIGNELYDRNNMRDVAYSARSDASVSTEILVHEKSTNVTPTNISYKIVIDASNAKLINLSSNLKISMEFTHRWDITAEGAYNAENGHLCMVGCGKLTTYGINSSHISTDCEILVNLQFASLNDTRGGFIKGTLGSARNKSDPLRFEDMSLSSAAYYGEMAERSIWRMDFEITMVLISNTLLCVFVGLQIFHVKRNPEVLSRISLVMLMILCLGHMIPLVLNFDAVFLGSRSKQTLFVSSDGWLEANEVAVRVITMAAFLLQIRLVQLVWTSKQNEGKSVFVLLPLYVFGCLIALVLNWARSQKKSLWDVLRSYAGLILDGFLFPQILFNVFGGSAEKALARSFYVGTSAVRLVPHAYNQYREHNYPTFDVNRTYYYANPASDFYSTAWDVLIPCGVIVLAVIVFLQQRNGGRWILPQRFRELGPYEKVPTVVDE